MKIPTQTFDDNKFICRERPFIHQTHDRMVHISNDRTRQRSDHRTLLHGRQLARRFVWLLLCVMTSMRHAQMTNQKRKKRQQQHTQTN